MTAMAYLLRVTLPDRPGSLGALAVALGSVGADIVSLDVVERIDGGAVDDIVVDVPVGTLPDSLITAAETLADIGVVSLRPFGGILDAHRELELIDQVATGGDDALQLLADRVPSVLRVGWALVLAGPGDRETVVARGSSAPESDAEPPAVLRDLERATALDPAGVPDSWSALDTVVAAAPLDRGRVLVIGRIGGPDFRPSEIARLGYVAGILRSLHT